MPQPLPPGFAPVPAVLHFIAAARGSPGTVPVARSEGWSRGHSGQEQQAGLCLVPPGPYPTVPGSPDICSSPIALEEGRMLLPLWPAVGLPLCPQRDVPGQAGSLAQLSDVPAPGQWDCRSCKAGDDREASRTECFWGTRGEEAGQPHPRASWHRTALQPCSQPRACLDRASVLARSIPKASGPGPSVQFGGMAALPSLLPAALCFYFFFSLTQARPQEPNYF